MYFEILAGGGVVGALAFAWLLSSIRRAVTHDVLTGSHDVAAPALVAPLVAIALHGLVDSFLSFAPTYILFAISIGLASASARGLSPAMVASDAYRV
jgi:hypothetical protein